MADQTVTRLVTIGDLHGDEWVARAAQHYSVKVESFTADDHIPHESSIYVTKHFHGDIFEELSRLKRSVIHPLVIKHCIETDSPLPQLNHPLYNYFLKDAIVCYSLSKKDKKQVEMTNKYLRLIRFMGAQSRKDMKSGKSFERTHLIESSTDTENYRCAVIFGIPILFKEWIDEIWQHRDEPDFNPNDQTLLNKHRIKPFYGLYIAFVNFDGPTEAPLMSQMEAETKENGGQVVDPNDEKCTHFVVNATKDNRNCQQLIDNLSVRYASVPDYIVFKSWFTDSLNMKNREQEENHQIYSNKRRSLSRTPSALARASTATLMSPEYDKSFVESVSKSELDGTEAAKRTSKTFPIFQELYETERNYMNILKAILSKFRDPLLEKDDKHEDFLPNEIEIKQIFGCLPPIVELHEKVLSRLERIANQYSDDNDIGRIFVEHSKQFLKVYPEYMNFLEDIKKTIDSCIEKYPRFDSFLKVAQKNPECGRQTLKDLMTHPFQRPLKYPMLLERLLNKTDKSKPDYQLLKEAYSTLQEVNKLINKGKENTEGQKKMFELNQEIENFPPTLISAHRQHIADCDVKLLYRLEDNAEIVKLDNYMFRLFLFNDNIILCKKRTLKRSNSLSLNGPNPHTKSSGDKKNSKKVYKWIETIDLALIKYIIKPEIEDFKDAFAIVTLPKKDTDRSLPTYPFIVNMPEFSRDKVVDQITRTMTTAFGPIERNITVDSDFRSLDFKHANMMASDVSKSKIKFMSLSIPRRLGISRSSSIKDKRRSLLGPAMSMESLSTLTPGEKPPASPRAGRRISRVFSTFLSPQTFQTRSRNPMMGSMTSLNENIDINNSPSNFSLPTTPAPRKKKCPASEQSEQTMQT